MPETVTNVNFDLRQYPERIRDPFTSDFKTRPIKRICLRRRLSYDYKHVRHTSVQTACSVAAMLFHIQYDSNHVVPASPGKAVKCVKVQTRPLTWFTLSVYHRLCENSKRKCCLLAINDYEKNSKTPVQRKESIIWDDWIEKINCSRKRQWRTPVCVWACMRARVCMKVKMA